jgi:parvulin-like peptidyl-prolyl isomerase
MPLRPLVALLVSAALLAQDQKVPEDAWKAGVPVPPGAVAIVGGLPVPSDLFVDEMAARHVRADSAVGRETLASLVDEALVVNEAARRNATVTDADIDCKMNQLDCQLKQVNRSLDAEMKSTGVTRDLFRAKLRQQLLLERLTREDQRIGRNDPVSNEQQKVWLKNRRDAAKIELDRSKLKRCETAVVDGVPIEDVTFVRALLVSAKREEVRRVADFCLQYVWAQHLLEQAGEKLTDADLDQEFLERKRWFESNPEYRGIEYETIVRERTGMDPVALKASRGFRVNSMISKLGRKLFSDDDVKGYYDTNLALFGPYYTVRHLMIRGSDRPQRDMAGRMIQPLAKAREQIVTILGEMSAKNKPFEDVARLYSEHMPSKVRGGLLDPFTPRTAPQPFPELGDAVTRLEIGKVSEPILTSSGYHLVRVERMDPPKPLDQVKLDIRQRLATNYFNDSVAKAPKGWDIKLD